MNEVDQLPQVGPIPPLEPTWYQNASLGLGLGGDYRPWSTPALQQQVIFKLSIEDYKRRMEHETYRLGREQNMVEQLREKTRLIADLSEQVQSLQTARTPNVAALREAYAKDIITLEEFDRLVLHCIAGME